MKFHVAFLSLLCLPFVAEAQLAGGGKDNSKEPIDISSDTLEVDQTQQIAVFTGNVVANQGNMHLRSDRMNVYYRKKDGEAAPGAPIPTAPPATKPDGTAATPSAIYKIVVEGNVVMATPEEAAQGAHGVYEVDARLFHLTENVILTRGKNILRGTKLDYNLANGRSVLVGAGNAQIPSATGGRVRGVFVPDDASDKPAAKPATAKPAATPVSAPAK